MIGNIVLARISDSLVQNTVFSIFFKVLFNELKLRWQYASDLLKNRFELKGLILCLKPLENTIDVVTSQTRPF